MENFDIIVVGGGSGLLVSSAAAAQGLETAIIEEGPMGGTCLNRGCIPSKMIIHSADVAALIDKACEFGIYPKGYRVNFKEVIARATSMVDKEATGIEEGITQTQHMTLFKERATFIGERTLRVGNKKIWGEKIIVAAGTRPSVPPIPGLKDVPFMTSDEALRLQKQPKKLTVIGGGYIATELAHFFGSLGTDITVIQRDSVLVQNEDREVSEKFTDIWKKKYTIYLGCDVGRVYKKKEKIVTSVIRKGTNERVRDIISDGLLVATGRMPNTDILNVTKAGITIDKKGFIVTNQFLETTAKNVWAFGDIIGRFMFKHSANAEAGYVIQNTIHGKRVPADYAAIPHAIFSSPQVAGVGQREQDIVAQKESIAIGRYQYKKTGMGAALNDNDGFVKVYADRTTRMLVGCHILGTDSATLIHEAVLAMKNHITADQIMDTVYVHPALSEIFQRAVGNIEW